MTLFESGDSDGTVSLEGLFDGRTPNGYDANDEFSIEDAAFLVCRGGWPMSHRQPLGDVANDPFPCHTPALPSASYRTVKLLYVDDFGGLEGRYHADAGVVEQVDTENQDDGLIHVFECDAERS